jgi:anaerobic selenocysteine-containing dehydrogenase
MIETRTSICRICECMCGIEVDVEDNRIRAIRPDRKHVATEGYACVKGIAFGGTQHSPDRVLEPMKREGTAWRAISWEQALSEIGAKLRDLRAKHGGESIAHWIGAAAGVNVITPLIRGAAFEALGSHAMYGNASLDCTNKFRVCEDMYGSPFRLPFPDVDHSRFLMFLGANPAVSGTSLFHLPHAVQRLRAVVRKGGRVVFVNPRRTETGSRASRSSSAPTPTCSSWPRSCTRSCASGATTPHTSRATWSGSRRSSRWSRSGRPSVRPR